MIAGLYLAGDAEWSLHMDHDAWVDLHSVEEYLRMGPSEWNAQGKITKTWPDRPEFQYLSGPCFLLSRHVRKVLIRSLVCNPQPVVRWGDVLIGLHLERCGVPLVDWGIDFLHYQTPEQITQNYCNV